MKRHVKQFKSWDDSIKDHKDLDKLINKYAEENNLNIVQITFSGCVQALVLFEEDLENPNPTEVEYYCNECEVRTFQTLKDNTLKCDQCGTEEPYIG